MTSLPEKAAWIRSPTKLQIARGETLTGQMDRLGARGIRLVIGTPADLSLERLGCFATKVPGRAMLEARRKWGPEARTWVTERPGVIAAVAGLVPPSARPWASYVVAIDRAPALITLPLGAGSILEFAGIKEWIRGGESKPRWAYFLAGDQEVSKPASEAGFEWHPRLQIWGTTDPAIAATMGAFATGAAIDRIRAGGIPDGLIPFLRFGPMLLPWRDAWLLAAAKRHYSPEDSFRQRGPRAGWRTTNVRAAERAKQWAPKPLRGLIDGATKANALRKVKPAALNLIDPGEPDFGLSAIAPPPPPPKHRLRWCAPCRQFTAPKESDAKGGSARHCKRCKVWGPVPEERAEVLLSFATSRAVREWGAKCLRAEVAAQRVHVAPETVLAGVREGRSLHPYQVQAIRHALSLPVTLNAMQVGAGKTICAWMTVNLVWSGLGSGEKILIVAPRSLLAGWIREAGQWLDPSVPRTILDKAGQTFPAEGVALASYERVVREGARWLAQGAGQNLKMVIADEAQYLKRPDTHRARAVLSMPAKRWLFLTATPVYNRPDDLAPILARASPRGYGRIRAVRRALRIVKPTHPTPDEQEMLTSMGELLRETIMIRPDHETIAQTRPAKGSAEIVEVNVPSANAAREREQALLAAMREDPGRSIALFAQLSALRRRVALEKVEAVADSMAECRRKGEAFLVFAHHREVCEALATAGAARGVDCTIVHGQVSPAERQRRCDAFMAGQADGLSMTLDTGGVGLNLQRASQVLIAELDWSPAALEQAEGRAWRLGQTRTVTVRYFVVAGTIDSHIANLCAAKESTQQTALGEGEDPAAVIRKLQSMDEEAKQEGAQAA